jgi:iron complex transport system ATP-binding protein
MSPTVEVKELSFTYDTQKVLHQLSARFNQGGLTSIIGPNGSGKSTLLKAMANILEPQKNSVLIDGRDVVSMKPRALAELVSVVPQTVHVDYAFSAFDIVLMGRHIHIKPLGQESQKDLQAAEYAMDLTDTLKFKERSIQTLSGGERQRVILARAIAQDAPILLLDEPITYLDLNHQMDLMNILRQLIDAKSLTVVAVLHDLNFAMTYSDWVIVLKDGAIFSEGKPEAVLTEETIEAVYGVKVQIYRDVFGEKPFIRPLG